MAFPLFAVFILGSVTTNGCFFVTEPYSFMLLFDP